MEVLQRGVFMESWPEQENWVQMMLAVPRTKATQLFELPAKRTQQEQALMERQLIGPRRVSKNRREPVKWPGLEIAPAV
jgi:hypothetical protein